MSTSEGRVARLGRDDAKTAAEACGIPSYMTSLSIFQVLLKNPVIAKPVHDVITTLLFQGELDARLRELVIMRTGWATGSVYEWTQHWKIAQTLGVEEADLLAVRDWRAQPAGHFSAAECAALSAVDDVASSGEISAATFESIRKEFGDDARVIELVILVATYAMVSTTLRSLDVPLEEGVAPWPPDGMVPGSPPGAV